MKLWTVLIISLIFEFIPVSLVKADYVLPYPSYMPGNKFYQLSLLFDKLENYWYWGNIGQVKYHLKLTDKYLVESKTLFEYNQYLLAIKSLRRSDNEFKLIPFNLKKADRDGEDTSQLKKLVDQAALKHEEVLTKLRSELPEKFVWTPEKQVPQTLLIWQLLAASVAIRHSGINK